MLKLEYCKYSLFRQTERTGSVTDRILCELECILKTGFFTFTDQNTKIMKY